MKKIPYIAVVGDKEISDSTMNVRRLNGENLGAMPIEKFVSLLREDIKNRR